jgi:hypothetical protein
VLGMTVADRNAGSVTGRYQQFTDTRPHCTSRRRRSWTSLRPPCTR